MSQKAVLIRINGELIDHVFHSVPDYEEAVRICRYYGYKEYNSVFDSHFLEYEFLNIVAREAGELIADDALLFLYASPDFEEKIYEFFELSVETIDSGTIEVMSEDLED